MATIGDVLVTVEDIENYKAPVGGLGEDMRRVYSLTIPLAISHIEGRLGFQLAEKQYAGYYTARSTNLLLLPSYPVSALNTFKINDTTYDVHSKLAPTLTSAQYWLDCEQGVITPKYQAFLPTTPGSIYVDMKAGWGTETNPYPQDLVMAGIMLTLLLVEERTRVGVKAKTIGPENISQYIRESKDYETYIESAIARHCRWI